MALRPFSLLLRRKYLTPHFFFFNILKPFSTQPNPNFTDSKPSNLSDRLSFVFDQIDVIERERTQKDDTLQRIRAWRESKTLNRTTHVDDSKQLGVNSKENGEFALKIGKKTTHDEDSKKLGLQSQENGGFSSKINNKTTRDEDSENLGLESGKNGEFVLKKCEMELVHPWPEWIELMERLVNQNYFDHKRKDEDKLVEDFGFDMSEVVEEGFDFTRDWKTVQTACLNFGRDRFDILRSLSRSDIQILVGYGCPTADKKVVFSAKLLRKHVHLDEGDVCSSCSLRSSCERAYLLTNKEDEARTIDIMRLLLTYGFDPVNGSVDNKSLLKQKSVKTVVRKLLHQIVKLSAVPIDPNLPQPVFKKPPPKVKQPPPPPRKRVGRDDVEMKKGDWLCPKCDFMNFAKNTVCLQCDAKRPKRQLLPGEWECPECNFLNYRRNTECFHCECRRPPDEFTENQMQERQQRGPRTRFEKVASGAEISSAWNFDFDDNESDGADIAAFECADSPGMGGDDFPVGFGSQGVSNIGGSDDDFHEASHKRIAQNYEGDFSAPNSSNRPGRGFDDFDDEEDEDDIDSYEIDTRNNQDLAPSSNQGFSEPNDFEGPGRNRVPRRTSTSPSCDGPDFNSDDDLPVHPNWKSSHAANSRSRDSNSRSRNLSFGSDGDISSDEDRGSRKNKKESFGSNKRELKNRRPSDSDDGSYGSESSDDDNRSIRNNRFRGNNKAGPTRGGNSFKGRGGYDFAGDSSDDDRRSPRNKPSRGSNHGGANSFKGRDRSDFSGDSRYRSNRNTSNDSFERSSRGGFRGGFKGGDFGGQKRNDRDDGYGGRERGSRRNDRDFEPPKRGGFGDKPRGRGRNDRENSRPRREERFENMKQGRFRENDGDQNFGDDRPRRVRIIER